MDSMEAISDINFNVFCVENKDVVLNVLENWFYNVVM